MADGLIYRRKTGTTLIELLTASTVFLLLMGVIMSFYISGVKVTRQQDQRSDAIRRALNIADKFEVLLSQSRLIWAGAGDTEKQAQIVLFTRLSESMPLNKNGIGWNPRAETIYLDQSDPQHPRFVHIDSEGQERTFGDLRAGDKAAIASTDTSVAVSLELLYYPVSSASASDSPEVYTHKRTIPIRNCEEF